MDLALKFLDFHFFSPYIYPELWHEGYWLRQMISIFAITALGGLLQYALQSTISYYFLFDRRLEKHPLFLENQVKLEITQASYSIPLMALLSVPLFFLEVRGYSRLYLGVSGLSGWSFVALSVAWFLMVTEFLIYWTHRGLHNKLVYKYIHKPHHKWKVPTPFASHAFNPVDGFIQSVPYHVYTFIFPLHKFLFLALFVFVNVWTLLIHDGDYRVPECLRPYINGAAHHTEHHLYYFYNYGQYFTLWDRIGGSFRYPGAYEGKLLIKEVQEGKDKVKGSE